MLMHIKTMGLNYLADGIEMAWKFIIVSLDRLLGVREAELKKKSVDRLFELEKQIMFMREQILDKDKRFE